MAARTPRVLIVDDETETLDLMKLTLQRNGFAVVTAESWDQITVAIERTYFQDQLFDVIILDLMMPDRSGFDIMRSLKAILTPMPPVIMLSAVTGIEQQIQARSLGVAKYMTKPTSKDKLIEAIKSLMKTK